jgi:hypothetical protein
MEVPSALAVLTALFGMGRGVTQPQEAPETINSNERIGVRDEGWEETQPQESPEFYSQNAIGLFCL